MPEKSAHQGHAQSQDSRPPVGPRTGRRASSKSAVIVGVVGALLTAATITGAVMMTGPASVPVTTQVATVSAPSAVAPTSAAAPATVPAPFVAPAFSPVVAPAFSPVVAPPPAPAIATSAKELAPTSPGTADERTVDSGLESVVARYTAWTSACKARGITVTVTQPPANGTASVTEGVTTVPAKNAEFGTVGRCSGMQIMGKQVAYRSRPGFHGRDVLAYEYITDLGERASKTMIITVR